MVAISMTDVSFLTGIPFDNSYAHSRWFTSVSEQYMYFKSYEKYVRTFNNFQKTTGRYYIDVSEPVHNMIDCNYMMFKNTAYQNKWFYCFILNVVSLNYKTTRVYFDVDVLQTWRFDFTFKPSYVVREHPTGANWNTLPEGLNIGNEYNVVKQYDVKPQPFYYLVWAVKQRFDLFYTDYDADGSFYTTPDSLSYYFIPIPYAKDGFNPDTLTFTDGTEDSVMGHDMVGKVYHNFMGNEQAVNNIVSSFVTEYLPVDVAFENGKWRVYNARISPIVGGNGVEGESKVFVMSDNLQLNKMKRMTVGNVFSDINESEEKLRYYPYTVIEVSDGRGNIVNYKPEGLRYINGNMVLAVLGSVSFSNYVAYALDYYNGIDGLIQSRATLLSHGLMNENPQEVTVLDDRTAAYLQGAKNTLAAKRQTWSDELSYQRISNLNRGATSALSLGGNAMMKNMNPNAYMDDIGTMVQSGINYQKAGVDYQNRINEQNAMLEDIDNLPPNLIRQGSNVNAAAGNDLFGVRVTIKRVKPEFLDRVRQYLHLFGYKTNVLKIPNLRTRTHFNYVQTTMANIQCDFYNDDINRIKEIFDRGITLWHTNDIYNYDVSNGVR